MNAVRLQRNDDYVAMNMGGPTSVSLVLHLIVFILATVGLPYIANRPDTMDIAITVELVDLAEVSQTNVEDEPDESEVDDVPLKRKPVYNSAESPPELVDPTEPEIEETPDIPEPPKEEEPEKPDVTEIKEPPKPKNKPRKEPPKPEVQEKEKPEEHEKDFTSLLKSLTPDEPEDSSKAQTNAGQGATSQIADFSKTMTRSELDDLNRGVQPCWNINAGGKNAEDLIVDLKVFVNPDLRVRDVQILDQVRYSTDSHFRASAEAARRALLNPKCSKLRLPPEKYDHWKVFIYTFDPSQML